MNKSPASPKPGLNGRRRILLVDSYPTKRDLRAKVLRKLGVEVDCAADISAARALWQADSYNLVLLAVEREPQKLQAFCLEIQSAKPPQRLAFLVGKPEYLGASPRSDTAPALEDVTRNGLWSEVVASLFTNACELLPRRYGFLEASWRIAATRSELKDPRAKAEPSPSARRAEEQTRETWADSVERHSAMVADSPLLADPGFALPDALLPGPDLNLKTVPEEPS
jgi:hypothetical protein